MSSEPNVATAFGNDDRTSFPNRNTPAASQAVSVATGPTLRTQQHQGSPSRTTRSQSSPSRTARPTPSRKRQAAEASTGRKRARVSLKQPPSCKVDDTDGEKKPAALENCCICMCNVKSDDLAGINGCEHKFCFSCIEKWGQRENTCPLCKARFTQIDRVNKKRKRGQKNTKKVATRDQQTDMVPGGALEGLLANFASRHGNAHSNIARLIFSSSTNLGLDAFGTPRYQHSTRAFQFFDTTSEEEDDNPLSSIIRAFHNAQAPVQIVRPVSLSAHLVARSYASNSNEAGAGDHAGNPLEIDDSDDEDDDAVEVVRVVSGTSS